MGIKGLAIVAVLLAGALALASSNPTMQEYEAFQDRLLERTLERLAASGTLPAGGVVHQLIQSKDSTFLKALVRSQTSRRNWYLFSLYETRVLSARLLVLGIAGRFFPLTDPEDALRELEQSALSPSR